MLYNKQTKGYVQKDTFIIVNYYLNGKQEEVKVLGKLTLRMNRFMEEVGDSTLRKGLDYSSNSYSNRNEQTPINNRNYNTSNQPYQNKPIGQVNTNKKLVQKNSLKGSLQDFKCLRL